MASKENITPAFGKVGMNKDAHMSSLKQEEYTHAKNTTTSSEQGDVMFVQSEPSNILSSKFKDGFKVVGRKNDPFSDKTYYFLTNPVTKVSEIGIIKNQHTLPDLSDTVEQCTDCDYVSKPSTPLEDRVQEPSQVYETLINDECNNCLNFNTQFPIKTVEIKNEKTGSVMYFTDNQNPPRYIQLNELEQYFFTGNELCGDDSGVTPVCADCEKMLMFKKSKVPDLNPEKIMLGGRLEQGTYEFLVAYSDSMGNETSRYFSITNPIYIFDRSDVVRNPEEIDDATNYAIKLEVQGLDTRYEHYKVAVIQHTEKNRGAPTYFVEGVHSTSDNTILYTTDKDKQRISLPELTVPSVRVDKFETIAAANGYLFGTGVTFSKKMNLQPVINLLSIYLNWQSHIANEDLYKDGIAAAKYKGYYRDETYATGIRFIIDGEYSPDYAFVGRPATTTDLEEIPAGNKDVDSVNKLASSCNGTDVTKRWQLYNTATELGRCCFSDDIQTNIITELVKKTCYIEPNFLSTITFSGISGEAVITIVASGVSHEYVLTYDTDIETTLINFVDSQATTVLTDTNLTVTSSKDILMFDGVDDDAYSFAVTNTQGDLNGQIKVNSYLSKLSDFTYTIDIEEGEEFINTEIYIDNHRQEICQQCNNLPTYSDFCSICDFINIENYPDHCAPEFNCTLTNPESEPELVREDTKMELMDVIGESIKFIERVYPTEYSRLPSPQNCSVYKTNLTDGKILKDETFSRLYGRVLIGPTVSLYWFGVREYTATNENCYSATDISTYDSNLQYSPSFIHNYYGALTLAELQTTKTSGATTTDITQGLFTNKVHTGALWFKKEISDEEPKFILEIPPQAEVPYTKSQDSDLSYPGVNTNERVRLTFFDSCGTNTPFYSKIIDMTEGVMYMVEKKTDSSGVETLELKEAYKTDPVAVITLNPLTSDDFYVAIDTPIAGAQGYLTEEDAEAQDTSKIVDKYRTVPTNGCFSIVTKQIEYKSAEVTFKEMLIRKKEVYQQSCNYEAPIVKGCEAFPYKFGEFAYTESTETYPDNKDLYDSSRLEISPTDLPNDIYFGSTSFRDYFEDKFVAATAAEKYVWKEQDGKPITDFRCEPIRHFKFPDNTVSPFMYEQNTAGFTESIIYPLGMTIPEGVINSFLDIAVKNNLITQKQRDTIKGYEIVRGNRTANQTVVARGLAYDIREYKEKNDIISYSSYPFNDLGPDKLNYTDDTRDKLIPHPFDGEENYKWTLTSPETDYNKIDLPDFMKVDGYMYGKSRGQFDEIKGHPRWTILGSKLRRLASTLATTEVVVETAIITSQAFAHTNLQVGFVNTVVPGGIISAIALAIIQAFGAVIYKYGRYKYQWLTSFKNMGSPKNFAYYYAAEGYYNYFKPNTTEGEKLRFLNVAQNIGNARYQLTDSVGDGTTAEKIEINNTEREETVLLSTGKNGTIKYPTEYVNYDNGSVDFNTSSLTFSSENNECVQGKSASINRNVASMYVTLKNFLPSQYGTIGSIEWLTTGYRGDLENPKTCETTECSSVFGGDVFIARHTIKRSIPLFTPTAMDVPSLTPFEYEFYNNIGRNPKYYVNYELNTEDNQGGKKFPDIKSDFELDCLTGVTGNYIIPPSKFYVYYHGIPNFLTETTINTWNRTAKPEPWNNFYPNVGDFMAWTQEETNPIERGNNFFYNNVYSGGVTPILEGNVLPSNYEQERFDMLTDMPNGTIYTLPDNSENSIIDPWLTFRPRDRFDFKAQHGKLLGLTPIENKQVLGSFEDQTVIFDAVDTLVDDGQAAVLGDAGIFRRRPRTFANTDLGYMGTQTNQMLSTELGHFKVDAERGQIFRILPGGKEVEEISAQIGGNPSGMRAWFKEQLPFKIKKQFPDIDIDNAYNGVGITMGWDSKFKRVFITKKDYIVNDCDCETVDHEISCPEGYVYDETMNRCVNQTECEAEGDIVFIVDYTTSQEPAVENIKNAISTQIVPALLSKFTTYRLGLVAVFDRREEGKALFDIVVPLSDNNETAFIAGIDSLILDNSGNLWQEEPTDMALEAVLNNTGEIDLNGTPIPSNTIGVMGANSYKTIFLVTDAAPGGLIDGWSIDNWNHADQLADQAALQDVTIFSILTSATEPPMTIPTAVSPGSQYTSYIMNNYAAKTGGIYSFNSLGQGIDSTIVDSIETGIQSCYEEPIVTDIVSDSPCIRYSKEDGFINVCRDGACPPEYTYNSDTGLCEYTGQCENNLDIVFVVDTTGEQEAPLDSIRNAINTRIVPSIENKFDTYRFGLVAIKGRREVGVSLFDIVTPMAVNNEISFTNGINSLIATGGFSAPQPTDMALQAVLDNTSEIDLNGNPMPSKLIGAFDPKSEKVIVLITADSPSGLDDNYGYSDWLHANALSKQAANQDIQIFSILTSQTEPDVTNVPTPGGILNYTSYIMNNYAEETGGEYYFKASGENIDDSIVDAINNNISCKEPVEPVDGRVELTDPTYFKDVSWTVSLSFNTGKWESFFDFKPNYYVAHNGYFQTGINSSMDSSEFGLWSHLLINTSYQVFYGKAYDWEIELPIQNQGVNKYLASFAYELDARRYKDEYDFAENKQLGFDEAIIFNNTNSSGKLNLELQKSISQLSKFPKTIGNTQTILQTTQDNEFRFNYFYNRVKNRNSGIPLWNYDENKLEKQINQAAVSFVSKKVLERIRGDYFLVNLKSKDTQHQKIFKILKTTENLYTK